MSLETLRRLRWPSFFLTLALTVTAAAWGQPPGEQYLVKVRPTAARNYPRAVDLVEADGSAVVLLQQHRPLPLSESQSLVLTKLDPSGRLVWSTPVKPCAPAGPACAKWEVEPEAVARGRDGFLVVGTLRGEKGFEWHLFIAHFTEDGAATWLKTYDGATGSQLVTNGVDIAYLGDLRRPAGETNPDAFMVLGRSDELSGADQKIAAFLFRVDGRGNLIGTVRRYLGQGLTLPSRLRRTRTQGMLALGITRKSGASFPDASWILQLDSTGLAGWERFYSRKDGFFEARLRDIAEGTHSLMAVGYDNLLSLQKSGSGATPGELRWAAQASAAFMHAIDSQEFLILSLASTDPQGDRRLVENYEFRFSHFVVAGGLRTPPPVSYDAWLARLDEDGNFLWQKYYPKVEDQDESMLLTVTWPWSPDILAAGSNSGEAYGGLVVSSRAEPRHGPKLCARESEVTFKSVCLTSEEGMKTWESIDLAVVGWSIEPGPQIRIEDRCQQ